MSSLYLLDTNVVSELSRPAPEQSVLGWLGAVEVPYLSVITVGELWRGCSLLAQSKRRTELEAKHAAYLLQPRICILPVTQQVAIRWGELSAMRQRMGRPLSMPDGLIAATALEHDLTLVTRNMKDFTGLNLTLIDPWQNDIASAQTKTQEGRG